MSSLLAMTPVARLMKRASSDDGCDGVVAAGSSREQVYSLTEPGDGVLEQLVPPVVEKCDFAGGEETPDAGKA